MRGYIQLASFVVHWISTGWDVNDRMTLPTFLRAQGVLNENHLSLPKDLTVNKLDNKAFQKRNSHTSLLSESILGMTMKVTKKPDPLNT